MLYYFFPAFEKQAISTHKNLVLGFYIPCSQGQSRVSCFRYLFFRVFSSIALSIRNALFFCWKSFYSSYSSNAVISHQFPYSKVPSGTKQGSLRSWLVLGQTEMIVLASLQGHLGIYSACRFGIKISSKVFHTLRDRINNIFNSLIWRIELGAREKS